MNIRHVSTYRLYQRWVPVLILVRIKSGYLDQSSSIWYLVRDFLNSKVLVWFWSVGSLPCTFQTSVFQRNPFLEIISICSNFIFLASEMLPSDVNGIKTDSRWGHCFSWTSNESSFSFHSTQTRFIEQRTPQNAESFTSLFLIGQPMREKLT